MMDIIQIADEIEKKIHQLESGRPILKQRAEQLASAKANYDKELAKTIICLSQGKEMELEGQKIQNPPATITERIARGICWKERLDAEKAEALYKTAVISMDALQAELNGWQSIYRHLGEK